MADQSWKWALVFVLGLGSSQSFGEDVPPGPRQVAPGQALPGQAVPAQILPGTVAPASPQAVSGAFGSSAPYSPYADVGVYYPKSRWFRDDTAPYMHTLTYGQGMYRPWIYQARLDYWYPWHFASSGSSPYWYNAASYNYSPPYNSGSFTNLFSVDYGGPGAYGYYPGYTEYGGLRYTGSRAQQGGDGSVFYW
jgi:hypothetical protein